MNLLKKIANLLIYSELLISLCAIAATCQTYLLLQKPILWGELLIMIGSSTMACYVLARLAGMQERLEVVQKRANRTMAFYALCILLVVTSTVCFVLFWKLKSSLQIVLIGVSVVTILYSLPLIPTKMGWKKLRDIGMLKIFLIAVIWTLSTAILPILQCKVSFQEARTWLIVLEKALFIFAITLPFDIRDLAYDESRELRTIPMMIGVEKTLYLAYGSLMALGFLAIINYLLLPLPQRPQLFLMLALLISYRTTAFLIQQTKQDRPDQFYTGLMDGTLLVQFGLVWGASMI